MRYGPRHTGDHGYLARLGVVNNLATPITNGHLSAGSSMFAAAGGQAGAPPLSGSSSSSAADVQGTGSLSAPHNTPLHVASLVLLAGVTIWGLHFLGFRVAFDAGLGRG
jgi:hypothetical protein